MSRIGDMLLSLVGGRPRVAGRPRSANGASSFHLIWDFSGREADRRLVEVAATLEVVVAPRVDSLYFWALQADFADARGVWGGGHTGLQWNRRYPGGRAVNWGGYAMQELGGAVLSGSMSSLPGFADDPHTLAFAWEPGRPYRLRIFASPDTPGAWRAEVTDLLAGTAQIIRELYPPSGRGVGVSYLTRPLVWSEVFADCDAPSVTVRWSDLIVRDGGGAALPAESATVNYQAAAQGGCANTTVATDEQGFLQITSSRREVPQGTRLMVPHSGS